MSKITIYFITLLGMPFFYIGLLSIWVFYGSVFISLPIHPMLIESLDWLLSLQEKNTTMDFYDIIIIGSILYFWGPMACITQALVIALLLGNKIIWPWGNVPLNQSLWAILWGCIYLSLVTLGVLVVAIMGMPTTASVI